MRGKAVSQARLTVGETECIFLLRLTPLGLDIDCRDLTNRVCPDAVCGLRRCNGHDSGRLEAWPLPCEETDKRPLIA
jgi:hypothetical protein